MEILLTSECVCEEENHSVHVTHAIPGSTEQTVECRSSWLSSFESRSVIRGKDWSKEEGV